MGIIPNWIRWLLFIPASFVVFVLIYPLLKILAYLQYLIVPGGYDFIDTLRDVIIYSGLCGFLFVYVGSNIAPKNQYKISKLLTAIFSFFIAGGYLFSKIILAESAKSSWFQVISFIIIGIIAAIAASFKIHKEYGKNIKYGR